LAEEEEGGGGGGDDVDDDHHHHLKGNELHRTRHTYSLKPTTFMLIMTIKCICLMYTVIKNVIYIQQKTKETKT